MSDNTLFGNKKLQGPLLGQQLLFCLSSSCNYLRFPIQVHLAPFTDLIKDWLQLKRPFHSARTRP